MSSSAQNPSMHFISHNKKKSLYWSKTPCWLVRLCFSALTLEPTLRLYNFPAVLQDLRAFAQALGHPPPQLSSRSTPSLPWSLRSLSLFPRSLFYVLFFMIPPPSTHFEFPHSLRLSVHRLSPLPRTWAALKQGSVACLTHGCIPSTWHAAGAQLCGQSRAGVKQTQEEGNGSEKIEEQSQGD